MSDCNCVSGWIIADGMIVDRCMVCNEPPWYRVRRRRRIVGRFWPLIFIAGTVSLTLGIVWAIVLFQRAFG